MAMARGAGVGSAGSVGGVGARVVGGCAGGIDGIGGGPLLAPILGAAGFSAYEVAPATLAATFLTSLAGIGTYELLQLSHGGTTAPDWALGAWIGASGFAASYLRARLQRRLPETSIRKLLWLIACLVAVRYLQEGVHTAHARRPAVVAR